MPKDKELDAEVVDDDEAASEAEADEAEDDDEDDDEDEADDEDADSEAQAELDLEPGAVQPILSITGEPAPIQAVKQVDVEG